MITIHMDDICKLLVAETVALCEIYAFSAILRVNLCAHRYNKEPLTRFYHQPSIEGDKINKPRRQILSSFDSTFNTLEPMINMQSAKKKQTMFYKLNSTVISGILNHFLQMGCKLGKKKKTAVGINIKKIVLGNICVTESFYL